MDWRTWAQMAGMKSGAAGGAAGTGHLLANGRLQAGSVLGAVGSVHLLDLLVGLRPCDGGYGQLSAASTVALTAGAGPLGNSW